MPQSKPDPSRRLSWLTNRKNLYLIILFWCLLFFVLNPLLSETGVGKGVLTASALLILISGCLTIIRHRRGRIVAISLLLITIGLRVWAGNTTSESQALGDLSSATLLIVLSGFILVDVFSHRRVTLNTVAGALCVFLFIGFTYSNLYNAVEIWEEGPSFRGLTETADGPGAINRQEELLFFSIVTLTTLGYGDISPISPIARSLAMVEAILGQLYLVVLVARLVALYGQKQHQPRRT